ncbi:hypothetical protein ASZ78_005790 [Callipepla squamata]|uniref:Ig-like domain-containing protein n=1 Tax=Callipepla squamata TaxID=9009 RepID=A0A226MNN4_CALSU|nr:hypothetical protein ASZ78_005790 [Callipepla squamata]
MCVVYGGQTQERLKKLDRVNGLLRIAVAAERKGENDGPDLTTSHFNEVINLNKSQPLYVEYEVLLDVPQIEGREKPVISYEGDSAILICKSHSYIPIAWTWYMTNGSEQIAINDSVMLDKYVIDKADPNVTHLKILKLTKEDDGEYWCEAAFELGRSKEKLKLRVLSLMVSLKLFLAIVAEVVIVRAVIFCFELYLKKKEECAVNQKTAMEWKILVQGTEEFNLVPRKILSEAKEEYKCSSMNRIQNGEHGSTRDVKQGITGV